MTGITVTAYLNYGEITVTAYLTPKPAIPGPMQHTSSQRRTVARGHAIACPRRFSSRLQRPAEGCDPQYQRRMHRTTIKGDYGLGRFEHGEKIGEVKREVAPLLLPA